VAKPIALPMPFEALLLWRPQFVRFARYHMTRQEDAEDVVQEAYVRAWVAWPPAHQDNLKSWMYRIVLNMAINNTRRAIRERDYHHKLRIRKPRSASRPPEDSVWEHMDTAQLVDHPEFWCDDRALALLGGLAPAQRRTALLDWVAEWSHSEIAKSEAMGSRVTVATRIFRTRQRCRNAATAIQGAIHGHA